MNVKKLSTLLSLIVGIGTGSLANEVFTVEIPPGEGAGSIEGYLWLHDDAASPQMEFALLLGRVDSAAFSLVRRNPQDTNAWITVHDWSGATPHELWHNHATRDGPPPRKAGQYCYLTLTPDLVALLRTGELHLRLRENGPYHESDASGRIISASEPGSIAIIDIRFDYLPAFAIDHLAIRYMAISLRSYQLLASSDLHEWTLIARSTPSSGQGRITIPRGELSDFRFFKVAYDPAEQPEILRP